MSNEDNKKVCGSFTGGGGSGGAGRDPKNWGDIVVDGSHYSPEMIKALLTDRNELAATVEALREHAGDAAGALGFLSHHLRGRMGEAALMDMAEKADALNEALKVTTQQHLRDVRAEAGRAGFIAGYNQAQSDPFTANDAEIDLYADEYAESVKAGE